VVVAAAAHCTNNWLGRHPSRLALS